MFLWGYHSSKQASYVSGIQRVCGDCVVGILNLVNFFLRPKTRGDPFWAPPIGRKMGPRLFQGCIPAISGSGPRLVMYDSLARYMAFEDFEILSRPQTTKKSQLFCFFFWGGGAPGDYLQGFWA